MSTIGERAAELKRHAAQVRANVLRMSHYGRTSHLGSSLSCVDILVAAYFEFLNVDPPRPDSENRDRLILSKGHAAAALYATLAARGYWSADRLDEFNQPGSALGEQPIPNAVPGVEAATGSLGHGLSLGVGMALAARLKQLNHRTLVVVSDGECNEGTVWEAAMFAAAQQLSSLTVVVDFNHWQATARSQEVMALDPLVEKWQAFGWRATEVDGHDFVALLEALDAVPFAADRPTAIVAHTVKGKGVDFMEDDNNWHYRIPNQEELQAALEQVAAEGD